MNIFLDGFDHYGVGATGAANMEQGPWTGLGLGTDPTATNPRSGTAALNRPAGLGFVARLVLPVLRTKIFVSGAWYIENIPPISDRFVLAQARDADNNVLADARVSANGSVELVSHVGGTAVRATSDPATIVNGVYQHFEVMFHQNGAASAMECRINGVTVCSATGFNNGSTPIGQFTFGQNGATDPDTDDTYLDDLRIGDDQGGVNDDWMGDKRVYTQFPDEDGSIQEWTPDSGGNAWSRVDEVPPDSDTSYIESATPGALARLRFPDLPGEAQAVSGIAYVAFAKKTDVGDAPISLNVISNDQKAMGEEQQLSSDYVYLDQQLFDLNPDGDIPWTPEAVNASEGEIEHIGGS